MAPRLTLLRQIASGGMGKVYQAVQHGAEGFLKTVAVKMIRSKYAHDERFVKMFILRQGFRDGHHGAVLCGLAAFSVFTKYAKLWNMQRLANGGVEGVPDE